MTGEVRSSVAVAESHLSKSLGTILPHTLQIWVALGLGHNSTLSHWLFCALGTEYKLSSYQFIFEKSVLWSLLETSRVTEIQTPIAKGLVVIVM